MPSSSKIIELRELLTAKYPSVPQKTTGCLLTEVAAVDVALQGGLPLGGMTEIVGQAGSGLLLAALIRATQRRRGLLALIDGGDAFDLAGVPRAALSRLLWVRSRTAAQAVQAADLLLRDGNLNLVVLDLRSISAEERVRKRLLRVVGECLSLAAQFAAWQQARNAAVTCIDWRFTTADARIKLKHLYPQTLPC